MSDPILAVCTELGVAGMLRRSTDPVPYEARFRRDGSVPSPTVDAHIFEGAIHIDGHAVRQPDGSFAQHRTPRSRAFLIHSRDDGVHVIQVDPEHPHAEAVADWIRTELTACPVHAVWPLAI